MDNNGDGKIGIKEYLEFMKDEGYDQMINFSFFNQLDIDRNGTLDFFEVMTVYYIVRSGRPFCDCCKKFITSTYLSCVGCFEDPTGKSFYLCLDCYCRKKCSHTHNGLSRFLDNYTLLEAMKKLKSNELRSPETSSRRCETVPVTDTRNAIVPRSQHVATTLGILNSAVSIANVVAGSSLCSIL
uniref:uncharacterized protein LOC122606758 n=1 Tax=Erigeron canadensis TaxID=72917 RepID=UPI001CB95A76|nr:uncharacterized protein LOC122606758 [Erigeron canadensis]